MTDPAPTVTKQYVAVGACVIPSDIADAPPSLSRCAVEPGMCHSKAQGEVFIMPWQIETDTPAADCQTVDQVQGARCHDDASVLHGQFHIEHPSGAAKFCVNGRQNSCHDPHRMNHTDTNCNLALDTRDEVRNPNVIHTTQYSKCDFEGVEGAPEDPVCRWDKESVCPGGVPARKPFNSERACSCDQVQTGACLMEDTNTVICAVSEHACGPNVGNGITWLHPHQVIEKHDIDCRLCPEDMVAAPPPQDPAPVPSPTPQQPHNNNPGPTKNASLNTNNDDGSGLSTGGAVFIGMLIVVLLVVPLVMFQRYRTKRSAQFLNKDTVYKDEAELPEIQGDGGLKGISKKHCKEVVDLTDVPINDDSPGDQDLYQSASSASSNGNGEFEQGNGEMA